MSATPVTASHQRGGFLRAVMVLVGGSALAHGLTAVVLPILARLYSPTDFGLLAVFAGTLSIIAVAACLRYELAIPLPESEDDAAQLLALSLICALSVSGALALAVTLAPAWISARLGQPSLAPHLWLLPLGVLLAGAFSALQFWYVRKKKFALLAYTRVAQSAGSAGTQVALGWIAAGPVGLLLGYVLNAGIACLSLGTQWLRSAPRISMRRLGMLAVEYSRFPKYSTAEALANSAAIQLPIIMIAAMTAPAEAGYLMMAMYVMQAPIALIGNAISQVYLSKAPDEQRSGTLGFFTAGVIAGLFKAGVGPLIAIGILSPLLFTLAMGPDWHRAGVLVAWMTPWFLMQLLSVPVSMALHVTHHQRIASLLQFAGILIRVGAVALAPLVSVAHVAEAYAISGFVFYGLYFCVILCVTKVEVRALLPQLARAVPGVMAWTASGIAIAVLFDRFTTALR